jgi:putative OmpL-like beta-barrel porin-2
MRSAGARIFARTASLAVACLLLGLALAEGAAGRQSPAVPSGAPLETQAEAKSEAKPDDQPPKPLWQYGAFADLGYLLDFNYPPNHLFRDRSTTFKVNELDLNMAVVYVKKEAAEKLRWGTELTWQAGKDSEAFGFSSTAPKVDGARWLRHFGPTDISYLAPVGNGLTIQAGLFNSFIGYDGLYARDNFTYTRPWGGDFTPYLMFGVNVSYPFTKKLSGTFFVINGYAHLSHPNNAPSIGEQVAYKATDRLSFKETLFYGPQQADTSLAYWRFFSDSILEWKKEPLTVAFEYQVGTEVLAAPCTPRVFWTSGQLPLHWTFSRHWSVTLRPEFYWDPDGRLTGSEQIIAADTESLEYRWSFRRWSSIVRLEHRYDDSRGPGGGFFADHYLSPGVVALTPSQNLLILGLIVSFDSSPR